MNRPSASRRGSASSTRRPRCGHAILAPLTGHPDPDLAGEAWLAIGTRSLPPRRRGRRPRRPGGRPPSAAAARLARMAQGRRAGGPRRQPRGGGRRLPRGRSARTARGARRDRQPHRLAPQGDRPRLRVAPPVQPGEGRLRDLHGRGSPGRSSPSTSSSSSPTRSSRAARRSAAGFFGGGARPARRGGPHRRPAVADGEWWRDLTGAFLHLGLLHIGFNMYAALALRADHRADVRARRVRVIYLLCAAGRQRADDPRRPRQSARWAPPARSSASSAWCSSSRAAITPCSGREARAMVAGSADSCSSS